MLCSAVRLIVRGCTSHARLVLGAQKRNIHGTQIRLGVLWGLVFGDSLARRVKKEVVDGVHLDRTMGGDAHPLYELGLVEVSCYSCG